MRHPSYLDVNFSWSFLIDMMQHDTHALACRLYTAVRYIVAQVLVARAMVIVTI